MPMTRTVAVVTGTGQVATREEPLPELKPGVALVKTHATLISPGTEMTLVRKRRAAPDPDAADVPFGYAGAGEIVEVDGDFSLRPGMRVATMGGGYALHADYTRVPVNLIVPIPDGVSYEEACYAHLAATALQAIRRADVRLGEYGAVLGQGIVGNCAAQLARLSGARVIVWETIGERLAIALACGIDYAVNPRGIDAVAATTAFAAPYGLDFAVLAFGGEATEAFEALATCMKVSADGHPIGRVVVVGGCELRLKCTAAMGNLDIRRSSRTGPGYHDPAYEHGAEYPAGFVQFTTQRNLREIISLLAEKRLTVAPMTTHRVPLQRIGEMADLLIEHPDRAMGVVLDARQ